MTSESLKKSATDLADVTFDLLVSCQEKEERFARWYNLSRPEFRCLRCFREEQQLGIKAIIQRLRLSGSRLTRILHDLEQKKYIRRVFDSKDRRSITVMLTPRGKEIVQQIECTYTQIHEEILGDVPSELHEPLIHSMARLMSAINLWLKNS